jgi:hypothetical protein
MQLSFTRTCLTLKMVMFLWNEDDFVTEEENMEKIKPFAEEEIKKALLLWKKQGCWARWVPY